MTSGRTRGLSRWRVETRDEDFSGRPEHAEEAQHRRLLRRVRLVVETEVLVVEASGQGAQPLAQCYIVGSILTWRDEPSAHVVVPFEPDERHHRLADHEGCSPPSFW